LDGFTEQGLEGTTCLMGSYSCKTFFAQVMTNRMGNPEAEKRAEFYNQHWTKEAVTRYFYTKVDLNYLATMNYHILL